MAEHAAVIYRAKAAAKPIEGRGDKPSASEIRIAAYLRCDQRKFRFDVQSSADRFPSIHLLTSGGFHTTTQKLPGKWETEIHRKLPDDSDWLADYPFLLAHGVVPLPHQSLPDLAPPRANDKAPPINIGGQRATFEFRDQEPVTVHVSHESHGLIARYEVSQGGRKVLEIRNKYSRDGMTHRLDEYVVLRFDAQGRLASQIEGRVTECRLDVEIPLSAFAPPRTPDRLRADLHRVLKKSAVIKGNSSLADVAQSLQDVLGDDIHVRIDNEAFENAPPRTAVDTTRLRVPPGEASLSQVLLRDLRGSRIDFYLDAQGIVLIPRNEAWNHAGFVNYAAKDYGKTTDEMRTLIFNAATPDDWSDVGGPATIITDKMTGTLMVLHTQSDHLRFEEQLRRQGDKP